MTRRDKIKQLINVLYVKYNKDLSLVSDVIVDIWGTCLEQVSDKGLDVAMRYRFGKFMPSIDEVEIVGLRLDSHSLNARINQAFNLYQNGKLETLRNKYFYRAFLRHYAMLQNEKNQETRCEIMRQTIFKLMNNGCAEIPSALITQESSEPLSKEKQAENVKNLKEKLPTIFGKLH